MTVAGAFAFGAGTTTGTEFGLVVTDHPGDRAGTDAPAPDAAAGVKPADRDDTTGRDDTPEDTDAAGPDPTDDPDPDPDCLLGASEDPADDTPPPRPDCVPVSAHAT